MLGVSLVSKSIAAKVLLGLAGLSTGVTAVAAGTGTLPEPAQQVAHKVAGEVGVPAHRGTKARRPASKPKPTGSPQPPETAASPKTHGQRGIDATRSAQAPGRDVSDSKRAVEPWRRGEIAGAGRDSEPGRGHGGDRVKPSHRPTEDEPDDGPGADDPGDANPGDDGPGGDGPGGEEPGGDQEGDD